MQKTWVRPQLFIWIHFSVHFNIANYTSKNCNTYTPLGSVRQRAVSRWPACRGWPQGSRHPLLVHHTFFLGRALEQHMVGSHRKCPAYCLQWTRCWSQNRLSWCSYLRLTTGSLPEVRRDGESQGVVWQVIGTDKTWLIRVCFSKDARHGY